MPRASCPACGAWVTINEDADVFDRVQCRDCGALLEIVDVEPFELEEAGD